MRSGCLCAFVRFILFGTSLKMVTGCGDGWRDRDEWQAEIEVEVEEQDDNWDDDERASLLCFFFLVSRRGGLLHVRTSGFILLF